MSGGAFGYAEVNMINIVYAIDAYMEDSSLSSETKQYMQELIRDIRIMHAKVNKLDLYLSGDTSEYK